jgi:ABC-2 type transport system permease protein
MRAIYILWLRQLIRFSRSKSRIIGSLAQPLLFLVALGFGLGPTFQKAGEGNYLQFLAPGVVAMSILFTAIFGGIGIIWDRQFGFLKETLVAPVSRLSIMIGHTLGNATIAALQGIIVLGLSILIGFRPENWLTIILTIPVMFLIAILFTALGTAIASKMTDMHGFQLIMNFLIMPLFFLSGALFPLTGLPKQILFVTQIDPMTYGVDALRALLINQNHFSLTLDLSVLSGLTVLVLLIGGYMFSKIEV